MSYVPQRIRNRRKQLGLTQEELAFMADVAQTQISRYEQGINLPTADNLARIAKALRTSTDWLTGATDDINAVSTEEELSDLEKQLLRVVRTKSPETQRKLLDIARML